MRRPAAASLCTWIVLAAAPDAESRDALRDAQRAWIRFRDAAASFFAAQHGAGGPEAAKAAREAAVLKLTDERTAALSAAE